MLIDFSIIKAAVSALTFQRKMVRGELPLKALPKPSSEEAIRKLLAKADKFNAALIIGRSITPNCRSLGFLKLETTREQKTPTCCFRRGLAI